MLGRDITENPLILLRILSIQGQTNSIDYLPFLRPSKPPTSSTTALFLDVVASTVVDRRGQSAAVAASIDQTGSGLHTTLYLAFDSVPPPNIQSHIQSIFSLLADSKEAESGDLVKALSKRMYRFSWERWRYDLRKLLDHLNTLETVARDVAPRLVDTFDKLRQLETLSHTQENNQVDLAMTTVESMYRVWVDRGLFAGE
ncbi:hypothetical protein PM082_013463 [Marasmius tenuissimus]|nr:hypothetical protein PM082_013463 [Marasmius tenuissimus]